MYECMCVEDFAHYKSNCASIELLDAIVVCKTRSGVTVFIPVQAFKSLIPNEQPTFSQAVEEDEKSRQPGQVRPKKSY